MFAFQARPASLSTLALALAGLCLPTLAAADIVYTQDFEGAAGTTPAGVTRVGGYDNAFDTDTANGTRVAQIDVDGPGYPRETAFLLDTGVTLDSGSSYSVSVDLSKSGGGNNQGQPAPQDVVVSLFAGLPTVTDLNPAVDVTADGATLLASNTYAGATDGTGLVTSFAAPAATGTLFIAVDVNNAGNPGGYGQIELDNVVVDVTPIPEPGTLGLGLAGAALLAARRRR